MFVYFTNDIFKKQNLNITKLTEYGLDIDYMSIFLEYIYIFFFFELVSSE